MLFLVLRSTQDGNSMQAVFEGAVYPAFEGCWQSDFIDSFSRADNDYVGTATREVIESQVKCPVAGCPIGRTGKK